MEDKKLKNSFYESSSGTLTLSHKVEFIYDSTNKRIKEIETDYSQQITTAYEIKYY